MYDSPHLIKSIRNCFETGYLFKGNNVLMSIIKKKYDIKNRYIYSLATKLTKNNFYLKFFTKMKVIVACQIVSNITYISVLQCKPY